jgi:hypothetical protein
MVWIKINKKIGDIIKEGGFKKVLDEAYREQATVFDN